MLAKDLELSLQLSEIHPSVSYTIRSLIQDIQRVESNQASREMLYELVDLTLNLYGQVAELKSQVTILMALRSAETSAMLS